MRKQSLIYLLLILAAYESSTASLLDLVGVVMYGLLP